MGVTSHVLRSTGSGGKSRAGEGAKHNNGLRKERIFNGLRKDRIFFGGNHRLRALEEVGSGGLRITFHASRGRGGCRNLSLVPGHWSLVVANDGKWQMTNDE